MLLLLLLHYGWQESWNYAHTAQQKLSRLQHSLTMLPAHETALATRLNQPVKASFPGTAVLQENARALGLTFTLRHVDQRVQLSHEADVSFPVLLTWLGHIERNWGIMPHKLEVTRQAGSVVVTQMELIYDK